jgi:hypothetical protein
MSGTGSSDTPKTVEKAPDPPAEKTPPATVEKPVATTADGAEPCCCNIIVRVDRIEVVTLTDAGSLPGIAKLFGNAADHVFIRAIDCAGKVKNYPDDDKGIEIDKGEHAGGFEVATVVPDHKNACHVHCNINIIVRKSSKLNVILDEVARIRAALFQLTIDLAKVMQQFQKDNATMQALAHVVPQTSAFLAAVAALSSDQAEIDRIQTEMASLNSTLAELLKTLVGTDDTLMDQFEVALLGRLPCGDKNWTDVLVSPPGWTLDSGNSNRASVTVDINRLGGHWKLTFAALRDCDH